MCTVYVLKPEPLTEWPKPCFSAEVTSGVEAYVYAVDVLGPVRVITHEGGGWTALPLAKHQLSGVRYNKRPNS